MEVSNMIVKNKYESALVQQDEHFQLVTFYIELKTRNFCLDGKINKAAYYFFFIFWTMFLYGTF